MEGGFCTFSFSAVNQVLEKTYTFTTPANTYQVRIDLGAYYGSDKEIRVSTIACQLELNQLSTDYEDYKNAQNLILPTSLRAIPVTDSSLATYTDENGQMWCADEIDLERGVRIQRCYSEAVTLSFQSENNRYIGTTSKKANTKIGTNNGTTVLCKQLSYHGDAGLVGTQTNGVRISAYDGITMVAYYNGQVISSLDVVYPLETPIETPLTSEQIAAYKALKTN